MARFTAASSRGKFAGSSRLTGYARRPSVCAPAGPGTLRQLPGAARDNGREKSCPVLTFSEPVPGFNKEIRKFEDMKGLKHRIFVCKNR